MLTIGIDTSALRPIISGGIVNTQAGVLREVFACCRQHRYVVFVTAANRSIFAALSDRVEVVEVPAETPGRQLDAALKQRRVDILFRSYPQVEQLAFSLDRQIAYIPDLQHEFLPQFFRPEDLAFRREAHDRVLGGAGAIATISEFSRMTLAARAPATREIFLMPPALPRAHVVADLGTPEPGEADLLPRKHYFYYPANLWPHKNHRRVFDAFRAFTRTALTPYAFVLTGDPTGWPELASDYADLDLRHLGHVSTRTVAYLYRRATALVFLSLFEGFGAPLLEAFHAGTPVLCSDTTSLPEVAGGAALLADPTDLPAMVAGLQRIAGDTALRRDLVARGKQRLAAYSWQRSAESFIRACTAVAARAQGAAALVG